MLSGWVNVTDDQGLGTPGAHVSGVVNYYGTSLNSDNGVTTATFEDTTDANGVYEFSYEQEILGVQPTSLQASLLSAPGWHEIEISVTADSRTQAPVDDLETATETIQYYVGPAPAGPLG